MSRVRRPSVLKPPAEAQQQASTACRTPLPSAVAAKVRQCQEQIRQLKLGLATAMLNFEVQKAAGLRDLQELDQRVSRLVGEVASDMGLHPAHCQVDWETLELLSGVAPKGGQ